MPQAAKQLRAKQLREHASLRRCSILGDSACTHSVEIFSRAPARFQRSVLLYICIPAYNEAPTVGLLLWRLRSVMQEFAREYEILVYNDGSTDATAETLKSYVEVLPLTVLGGQHRGYAHALDALVRAVAKRTRYPRRDGMVTMQADFTDRPEDLPELIRRFEGGADVVVAEREVTDSWPAPVRWLRRLAPLITRRFVDLPAVKDPFGTLRVYRISVLRDLLKTAGEEPVVRVDGWAANVELLVRTSRFARRVESIAFSPRYELRPRATRVRPWSSALALYRSARALRGVQTVSS
jgi:glycosyltransferase involved in cell wall biosynthesis